MHALNTHFYDSLTGRFPTKATLKALGPNDVKIRTTHSGICFTDVHAKHKGCGLGHEGVGIVVDVGTAVKQHKTGDCVGWGWLHSSCGHCSTCVSGYRQYCAEARGFAFSDMDQGAFSDFRIIDSEFAYQIPEAIHPAHAAPLMCAGASVYEALDAAGTKSHDRVGVVGVGGLGHMAILFANAMGCSVTAFSRGMAKRSDALELGADGYHDLGELPTTSLKPMNINTLLITSNAVPGLEHLLPFLARRATIVLMTIQQDSLTIPYMSFVLPGHRLIASTEASRENHIKLLDFAARKGIRPWIQLFKMDEDGIAEAFRCLEAGEMRYRGVLYREGC